MLGGAALGFVPGLPAVTLDPEVVLVVFLPPLLYGSSIYSNFDDLRESLRGLAFRTIGLVLVTMLAVASAAHLLVPGMSWEAAFVLGAIVSPTDPLAATVIMRRLDAPRFLVSNIEGEGLFNDATALVAYRVAVAAVVAGSFSLGDAGLEFLYGAAGGVAIGLLVGAVVAEVRRRTVDPQLNVTLSLLTGYAAYVPADALGASGILATVVAGIFMAVRGPSILPSRPRLQSYFVWDVLDFVVNALLFVLVGLQLPTVLEGLDAYDGWTLLAYATLVSAAVIGVRLAWFFSVPYAVRGLDRRLGREGGHLDPRWQLVMAWSGMRGGVSLAIALALPLATDAGEGFPKRDLIVFLTFAVILATLVIQGLSLSPLLRRLGVRSDEREAEEESRAQLVAAEAALEEIDSLADGDAAEEAVERLRDFFEHRRRRFSAQLGETEDEGYEERSLAYQRMQQRILDAQRRALLRLRGEGQLSNEDMNRILRDLDLAEERLEV